MTDDAGGGGTDSFGARLAARADGLSPACRRVADYIDGNRTSVLASSAMELAAGAGTSDATVIRTVQALGFTGLGALKQALLASAERPQTSADAMRRTLDEIGDDSVRAIESVFEAHEEAMAGLRPLAVQERITAAVTALHPVQRVAIFGIGPSAALSTYVALILARTGRRSLALNASGAMLADQLLDLRRGDGLLVLAYGRAYSEVTTVFDEARRLDLPVVLVTDSLERRLARRATVVLPAQRGRADHVALHGATLVCLEALVLGLAAASRTEAIATLDRLDRLRGAARGASMPPRHALAARRRREQEVPDGH